MPRKRNACPPRCPPRCLLCNCVSHTTECCNSNMKGRREIMSEMDCMMSANMPDFKSFPVNELRYIVVDYQYSLDYITFPSAIIDLSKIKLIRRKISLTLPKTRMVCELVKRWHLYAPIRSSKQTPPEDEECPICIECMTKSRWNPSRLRWDICEAKTPPLDALFPRNIKTQCGHVFCGSCWERHYTTNSKYDHTDTDEIDWGEESHRMYLSCPLCRHMLRFSS